MVDAKTVYQALGVQSQRQCVDCVKDCRLLHAHTYQIADFEEPAPIDAVSRAAPPSKTVVLALQQGMQALASIGMPGVVVLACHCRIPARKPQRKIGRASCREREGKE